ncbi:hypothetical protein GCM10028809_43430 [Spirosoma gilvum]
MTCFIGCLLALISSYPINARGVLLVGQPFDDANQIFITTTLADQQAYQAIMQVLTDRSILFSASTDGLLISSQPHEFKAANDLVFVGLITVTGGVVKLTGQMRSTEPQSETAGSASLKTVPIRYHNRKMSLAKIGFLYLDGLAHRLQPVLNGIIRYKYQKSSR